ncbi:hypothetical protein KDH_36940 [Dictyobacter sp. S3.2.2.5]|uniref:Uncharacterized protein n=1 Tax=Dictyobacter halimunensis TaxID=3026934 RepID=A0ABQ6FT33_9CHLR|nr:hypothetical protein KDH_36940 [Dictyobacter sp. S3.2.2.5]
MGNTAARVATITREDRTSNHQGERYNKSTCDPCLWALAQEALGRVREQIHEALAQEDHEPAIALLIRTLLRAAYEQRNLFLLICVGESHLLTQANTHRAQQGLPLALE